MELTAMAGGIGSWPRRRRVKSGERPAIVFRDRETSYADLAERVNRLAAALQSRGVGFGDRVAYLGNNHPSFVECLFAVTLIGAIFVPLNTRLSAAELGYQVGDCGARVLIANSSQAALAGQLAADAALIVTGDPGASVPEPGGVFEAYEELIATARPADLRVPAVSLADRAIIVYTSGTTGRAKGAVLSHGNLTWNAINVAVDYDLVSSDRALMISPLFHVASLGMGCLPVILKGATLLLEERFIPGEALRSIERLGATAISGVPTTYQLMLDAPEWAHTDISSLRLMTCGGSPVPERVRLGYQERGLAFSGGYGMTETSPGVTLLPAQHAARHLESAGLAHFFTEYRLRDLDSGQLAGPGDRGEIEVRGPNVFLGYWANEDATRSAFTEDGWLRTGDVGIADPDGFLQIMDRTKDMIISGGENVYSAEVELAILGIEGITGAAVIGIPHETWGEVPHAIVTLAEGFQLDAGELFERLCGRLARYKVPRTVEVVDELPRTASGKVQKNLLRAGNSPSGQRDQRRAD
jgi:acyl-CoA synthetase (AMP-forming)/AMP-acid ligase II